MIGYKDCQELGRLASATKALINELQTQLENETIVKRFLQDELAASRAPPDPSEPDRVKLTLHVHNYQDASETLWHGRSQLQSQYDQTREKAYDTYLRLSKTRDELKFIEQAQTVQKNLARTAAYQRDLKNGIVSITLFVTLSESEQLREAPGQYMLSPAPTATQEVRHEIPEAMALIRIGMKSTGEIPLRNWE